jgi:nucleoid DNA-binding protein
MKVLQMNFLQCCRLPLKRKATVQGKFSTWMKPDFSGHGMPSQQISLISEKTTPWFKAAKTLKHTFA